MVCCVYSLEYTQHTISWWNKKISLNICFLELSEEFRIGTQKRVRISHGKWAIGVRAIEVRLYFTFRKIWTTHFLLPVGVPKTAAWVANSVDPDQTPLICVNTVCLGLSVPIQWTLVTTTAFVPKDVAIKMNLLLYRILNEQTDV